MMNDIKKQFPIFDTHPHLHYLDTAASALTPACVIDAVSSYYKDFSVNAHRGLYTLSADVTSIIEETRNSIATQIGAASHEIIFTSGTTHGINMAAHGLVDTLQAGDEIVLTRFEHHANILPWQQVATRTGTRIVYLDVTESGMLDETHIHDIITEKTKIVSFTLVSNAIGTVLSAKSIIARAREVGAIVIVDAAQAVPHQAVSVCDIDADIIAWSGHKMYGPTGIGVLYIRERLHEFLRPFMYGGHMVREVTDSDALFGESPDRYETGTLPIAGIFGLHAAMGFLHAVGYEQIAAHEQALTAYAVQKLQQTDGINILGPAEATNRAGIIAFTMDGVHAHDMAEILNRHQGAIRAGHHCAIPLARALGVTSSVRLSLGIYNSRADIDAVVDALNDVKRIFSV